MVNIVNPRQNELFDMFKEFLSPLAYKTLISGWQGVFRHVILEVLPAYEIASHFNPTFGRPTKELYSIAGLLLIKEFMDWTEEEAANAYMFNVDIQYALNLGRDNISMSVRTLQRELNRCGVTYKRLLDQCIYEKASELLLHSNEKIIDVSLSVGFQDPSHFSRSFKRVSGFTPKEFRIANA